MVGVSFNWEREKKKMMNNSSQFLCIWCDVIIDPFDWHNDTHIRAIYIEWIQFECNWKLFWSRFRYSFILTGFLIAGIDFKIKTVELGGKKIKLQIWDTGECAWVTDHFGSNQCYVEKLHYITIVLICVGSLQPAKNDFTPLPHHTIVAQWA